jgi:hypothetical protein
MGVQVKEALPNGDFALGYDDLLHGQLDRLERIAPV